MDYKYLYETNELVGGILEEGKDSKVVSTLLNDLMNIDKIQKKFHKDFEKKYPDMKNIYDDPSPDHAGYKEYEAEMKKHKEMERKAFAKIDDAISAIENALETDDRPTLVKWGQLDKKGFFNKGYLNDKVDDKIIKPDVAKKLQKLSVAVQRAL